MTRIWVYEIKPNKTDINKEDIAIRLIDFGILAPSLSFLVKGAMIIYTTESEDK